MNLMMLPLGTHLISLWFMLVSTRQLSVSPPQFHINKMLLFTCNLFAVQKTSFAGNVGNQQRDSKRHQKYLDARWISLRQSRKDQLQQIDQMKTSVESLKKFKYLAQSSSHSSTVRQNLEPHPNICKK